MTVLISLLCSQEDILRLGLSSTAGLLLHPTVDIDLDEEVIIQGHSIRFATVNLGGTAVKIKDQLMSCINSKLDLT